MPPLQPANRGPRITPQIVVGLGIVAMGLLLTAGNLGWVEVDDLWRYWPLIDHRRRAGEVCDGVEHGGPGDRHGLHDRRRALARRQFSCHSFSCLGLVAAGICPHRPAPDLSIPADTGRTRRWRGDRRSSGVRLRVLVDLPPPHRLNGVQACRSDRHHGRRSSSTCAAPRPPATPSSTCSRCGAGSRSKCRPTGPCRIRRWPIMGGVEDKSTGHERRSPAVGRPRVRRDGRRRDQDVGQPAINNPHAMATVLADRWRLQLQLLAWALVGRARRRARPRADGRALAAGDAVRSAARVAGGAGVALGLVLVPGDAAAADAAGARRRDGAHRGDRHRGGVGGGRTGLVAGCSCGSA